MDGQAAERDVHDLIERHQLIEAPFDGEIVERRDQHRRLYRAAFQCGKATRAAADLQESHVLLRVHAVFAQDHDRFAVRRAAETADAEVFAFEIFHAFYIRAGHEIVVRAVHGGHDDSHRQAGDRRANEVRKSAAVVDVAGDDAIYGMITTIAFTLSPLK